MAYLICPWPLSLHLNTLEARGFDTHPERAPRGEHTHVDGPAKVNQPQALRLSLQVGTYVFRQVRPTDRFYYIVFPACLGQIKLGLVQQVRLFFLFLKQFYYTDRFSGTNLFSRINQWRSNMVLRFIKSNTIITKLNSSFTELHFLSIVLKECKSGQVGFTTGQVI